MHEADLTFFCVTVGEGGLSFQTNVSADKVISLLAEAISQYSIHMAVDKGIVQFTKPN